MLRLADLLHDTGYSAYVLSNMTRKNGGEGWPFGFIIMNALFLTISFSDGVGMIVIARNQCLEVALKSFTASKLPLSNFVFYVNSIKYE